MQPASLFAAGLLLLGSLVAAVDLPVEHSLDGKQFVPAGTLTIDARDLGDTSASAAAVLNRHATPASQLKPLLEADGLYRLRLPSDLQNPGGSPKVVAVIPARCWAAERLATPLSLQVLPGGRIAGLSFDMHCTRGGPGTASSLDDAEALLGEGAQLPEAQYVRVQRPVALPELSTARMGVLGGEVPGQPAAGIPAGVQPSDIAAAAAMTAEGGEGGVEGKGSKQPPKDERTWLQKNWMFVIPAGMALMNMMGNALGGAADGARQRAAAREGRPAGAASRR